MQAIHEQRSGGEDIFKPPLQSSEWNSSMQESAVLVGNQRHGQGGQGTKRTLREVEPHQLYVSHKNAEFEAADLPGGGVPEKKMKTTVQPGEYEGYSVETQLPEQTQNEGTVAEGEAPGNFDPHLQQQPLACALVPDENVEAVIQRINTEAREIYSKWQEDFRESEAFEAFCPARLDELLKDARAIHNSLVEQKERFRARLGLLSRTLQ